MPLLKNAQSAKLPPCRRTVAVVIIVVVEASVTNAYPREALARARTLS